MDDDSKMLKIKSMDNQTFEVKVGGLTTVGELKRLIELRATIPINRQRLIFRGRILNNQDTLSQLEDGSFIHLVANIQNDEVLNSPQRQMSISSIDEQQDQNIRTISDAQDQRRQQRKKVLQQRLSGFPHLPSNPSSALYQNLNTINQLIGSFNNMIEVSEHGQIFSYNMRDFELGAWVDVKDRDNEWQEGQVIAKQAQDIQVHFDSQSEWFPSSSTRIATFHSHTVQNVNATTFSPIPNDLRIQQNSMNISDLFSLCAKTMKTAASQMERLSLQCDEKVYNQKQETEMQSLINGMIEEQRRIQEGLDAKQEYDVTSVKSLKSMKSEKVSIDYETSSIKSMNLAKIGYIQIYQSLCSKLLALSL